MLVKSVTKKRGHLLFLKQTTNHKGNPKNLRSQNQNLLKKRKKKNIDLRLTKRGQEKKRKCTELIRFSSYLNVDFTHKSIF